MTQEQLARFVAEIPSAERLAASGYKSAQEYAYAVTSDAHKDAYGIRCRWMAQATVEELAACYFGCVDVMLSQERAEQDEQAAKERDERAHAEAVSRIMSTRSTFTIGQLWPA